MNETLTPHIGSEIGKIEFRYRVTPTGKVTGIAVGTDIFNDVGNELATELPHYPHPGPLYDLDLQSRFTMSRYEASLRTVKKITQKKVYEYPCNLSQSVS